MKRESPLIILWLDNLGVFHPLIGELGLTNIATAFEGGTAVRHLLSPMPSVTESAEVVVKAGCGLNQLPVLGEVTFDRASGQYFNLKQTDFDKETGIITPVEGAPRLADFVGPALAERLIPNLGFTVCQIGWKLGQTPLHPPQWGGKRGGVISLEDDEAIRLEATASYDIIPLRIQALLRAMQDYEADLYLLNISGDSIVHDEGLAGQAAFMKRLDEEFPALIEGLAAQAKDFTFIMFSDHGPRPVQGHLKPEEFLAGIEGLIFAGEASPPSPLLASGEGRGPGGGVRAANAAVVSNGRGSLYLYVRNPDPSTSSGHRDKTAWRRTAYRQLRDYHGQDILATIADQPETAFVVCNREEGGIAILSAEGEATLSTADGGALLPQGWGGLRGGAYQLAWGKDPLGLDEIEGRVVSAQEMLERTHDKPFPYPLQWLELLQAPCCGDVMIVVDKYAFFWDKPWVITTHGGPSRGEVGTSLLAAGPEHPEAGIRYGQQIACGSIGQLYNSLRRILYRRPPRRPEADLLFGARER
ncbi:MAG: hypothetical protein ISS49_15005 [Anaerolineae bacterium]|nr:hypothetical protein [Anaerolineae bacterium]